MSKKLKLTEAQLGRLKKRLLTESEEVLRFNRHKEMNQLTMNQMSIIRKMLIYIEDDFPEQDALENYIYGLYDGYYYKGALKILIPKLYASGYKAIAGFISDVLTTVDKYDFGGTTQV